MVVVVQCWNIFLFPPCSLLPRSPDAVACRNKSDDWTTVLACYCFACSYPSRYMTETGSWEHQRFVVTDSRLRLEEYAQAAEKRRNTSRALQEHTRSRQRASSISPGRAHLRKQRDGSSSLSGSPDNRQGARATVHSSASAPDIARSVAAEAAASTADADTLKDGNLPPIASRRRQEHGRESEQVDRQQTASRALGDGANDPRARTVTPSFGHDASIRGPVRGWASLSPERSSRSGRYEPSGSSSWFRKTRPNWYGLDSRTQQAF